MLRQYHSELGESRIHEMTARYNSFIGKWAIRTKETLSGRGIKVYEDSSKTYDSRTFYYVTDKAFEKLCNTYDIDLELLFD